MSPLPITQYETLGSGQQKLRANENGLPVNQLDGIVASKRGQALEQ